MSRKIWSAGEQLLATDLNKSFFFGGDGTDGALSISSGTTTIDLSNASVVVKNYSSISITGTGDLAFSNPASTGTLIILKSKGAVILTSSATPNIDLTGIGADGGAEKVTGTDASLNLDSSAHGGDGATSPGAGSAGAIFTNLKFYTILAERIYRKGIFITPGSGGGGGGHGISTGGAENTAVGGAGGNGGGALLIECAGDLNFTGDIAVDGDVGGDGGDATINGGGAGGGGGGGAGMALILYNTQTSVAGTITNAGGVGGASGIHISGMGGGSSSAGGGGGGGGAYGGAGGIGGAGVSSSDEGGGGGGGAGNDGAGSAGVDADGNNISKAGGAGGASLGGLVIQNTEF